MKVRAFCTRAIVMCTVAMMSLGLCAKTTTWTGPGSGKFSSSSNWNSGAPEPGDTVIVNGAVTWESEEFSIGEAGLTLTLKNTVTSSVKFTGAGEIRIAGGTAFSGELRQTVNCEHTGGTTITGGALGLGACTQFGSGKIVVGQESDAVYGSILGRTYGACLLNDIEIDGDCLQYPFWCGNDFYVKGNITATGDFRINAGWGTFQTLQGAVSAQDHKIILETPTDANRKIALNGTVNNASLEKIGAGIATIGAACSGDSITISGGKLEIAATGSWEGNSITVDGNTAVFSFLRNSCISKTATLTVKNGGMVNLGASAVVAELWVGDVQQEPGIYTAAKLPAVFSGSGQMIVGNVKMWNGGASGRFSDSANWSGGAPETGDILIFDTAVTLSEESFAVGADGITIICNADVVCNVVFTGEGFVVKKGSKSLSIGGVPTLVMGFRIEDGVLYNASNSINNPLGTVPIEITGTGNLQFRAYYTSLANDITIKDVQQTPSITINGPGGVRGAITANCDFTICDQWQKPAVQGKITAPGKTVTLDCESGSDRELAISGEIDASLMKTKAGTCTFSGTSVGDTNVLTVAGGTLTIAASKVWNGKEVHVEGSGSVLALSSRDNLTREAVVSVSNGGKLDLAEKVKVKGLIVNGLPKETGCYTSQNLPEVITGSGMLTVGQLGLLLVVE